MKISRYMSKECNGAVLVYTTDYGDLGDTRTTACWNPYWLLGHNLFVVGFIRAIERKERNIVYVRRNF